MHGLNHFIQRDPVQKTGGQALRSQMRPWSHDHILAGRIDVQHIQGLAAPAEMQPPALADGEIKDPIMVSQYFALQV